MSFEPLSADELRQAYELLEVLGSENVSDDPEHLPESARAFVLRVARGRLTDLEEALVFIVNTLVEDGMTAAEAGRSQFPQMDQDTHLRATMSQCYLTGMMIAVQALRMREDV